MITEKEISKHLGKIIKSPIRVGNLTDLGMQQTHFLSFFKPFFNLLKDDVYLVRGQQISYLKNKFPQEAERIEHLHQPYFQGQETLQVLQKWINRLDLESKKAFNQLSVITRRRNISSFLIEIWDGDYFIERTGQQGFEQNVGDFRGWTRVFSQANPEAVENELFNTLLKKIAKLVVNLHPETRKLQITSHFMRTLSHKEIKGENAPEGMHEDGAQYIMSALVIDRKNCLGGESRIYEKTNISNELIFSKVLQAGEFIFQADTGEEYTFGNDLWHDVTPIQPIDTSKPGIRDIIGFDIDLL